MRNEPTPTELETLIQSYFEFCDSFNMNDKGEIIKPYTLSGLLCHTGLTKGEFERLMGVRKYTKMLTAARARIEAFIEENALTGELSCNASLNSLKYHFGWGDKASEEKESTASRHITLSLTNGVAELAK